jgi:iron complex transport system ATP-binding protein
MILEAKDISVDMGGAHVLRDVSFSVDDNQWLMIIGPNGAGKTTLLNCITNGAPCKGVIKLGGVDIKTLKPRELARHVGFLTQMRHVEYDFTVEEVVSLGRYAHDRRSVFGFGGSKSSHEKSRLAISDALRLTGLSDMRNHSALTLSGGEIQRMFLAQALAQSPRLLLLDEPSTHLDPAYQKKIFTIVREWMRLPGRAVISVSHDIFVAKHYADDVLLLKQGELLARGPGNVFNEQTLKLAYDMDVYGWIKELCETWKS